MTSLTVSPADVSVLKQCLRGRGHERCIFELDFPSSLTELSIAPSCCPHPLALLSELQPSLQRLNFSLPYVSDRFIQALGALRFPSLRSFATDNAYYKFSDFIDAHRTQLESLSLAWVGRLSAAIVASLSAPFPRLKRLAIYTSSYAADEAALAALAHQPLYLSLLFKCHSRDAASAIHAVRTVLTSVELNLTDNRYGYICDTLHACSRLVRMHLPVTVSGPLRLPPGLQELCPLPSLDALRVLASSLRVCTVRLCAADLRTEVAQNVVHTASLHFAADCNITEVRRFILQLIGRSPKLLRLSVELARVVSDAQQVTALCDEVNARHQLDALSLSVTAAEGTDVAALQRRRYGWLRTAVAVQVEADASDGVGGMFGSGD